MSMPWVAAQSGQIISPKLRVRPRKCVTVRPDRACLHGAARFQAAIRFWAKAFFVALPEARCRRQCFRHIFIIIPPKARTMARSCLRTRLDVDRACHHLPTCAGWSLQAASVFPLDSAPVLASAAPVPLRCASCAASSGTETASACVNLRAPGQGEAKNASAPRRYSGAIPLQPLP